MTERRGLFHYLSATVESSLWRNGRVRIQRNRDGSDGGAQGVDLEEVEAPVEDARALAQPCTLEDNGFALLSSAHAGPPIDFLDHDSVVKTYYPACAEIVKVQTDAAQVFAFDHNVRSAQGKASRRRIQGGQQVQGPAHLVHGDYTLTSAPQRLRDLACPPSLNDTLRPYLGDEPLIPETLAQSALASQGRFAIINVWRNVADEPVLTHPLALCDAQTVVPEDLVVFEIHYEDRVGENYFSKHASGHRWYCYPEIEGGEALLIKQWDSAGRLARSGGAQGDAPGSPSTFSFHSAFEDPMTPPDAPDRWSIEVRCVALYD